MVLRLSVTPRRAWLGAFAFAFVAGALASVSGALAQDADWKSLEKRLASHDEGERSAAVRAIAEAGGARAVELLLRALEDEKAYVRDFASEKLVEIADRRALEEQVFRGFEKREPRARLACAALLSRCRAPWPWPPLYAALKERDPRLREVLLSGLVAAARAAALPASGERPKGTSQRDWDGELARRSAARASFEALDAKAFAKALEPLWRDRDRFVRASAVELAALGPEPACTQVRERCARDADFAVRLALFSGALTRAGDHARDLLLEALRDPAWQVRSAAAREIGAAPFERALVEALLRALEAEEPDAPARRALAGGLEAQTHMRFGDRVAEWQRWWSELDPAWTPAPDRAAEPGADQGARTSVAWHGLPIDARRVVFVIDDSGSMRDALPAAADERPRTKRELVDAELARVVAALPEDVEANVLLFADGVEAWRDGLAPLAKKDREELLSWVRARPPRGATNLLAGLLRALEDPRVEAIYLLSDGAPSAGEQIFRELVLARVRERNRFARARIHTAAILAAPADEAAARRIEQHRRFLADLAAESGGRAVEVR